MDEKDYSVIELSPLEDGIDVKSRGNGYER